MLRHELLLEGRASAPFEFRTRSFTRINSFPAKPTNSPYFCKKNRLNSKVKIAEMLGELEHCNCDIVLFSEKRRSCGTTALTSGDTLFSSTRSTNAAGVAILLHKRHVNAVHSVHILSERLMYLDAKLACGIVRFVSVCLTWDTGIPIS